MKPTVCSDVNAKLLILLVSAAVIVGCGKTTEVPKPIPTGEGRLAVDGGHIWYRVSGSGNGIPVVLLHGGPGLSSFYLKPFEDLGNDRQVVRYDQLGGGKSDKVVDTTLFTIGHFVEELESLRNNLGIDKWHVLGHSWGTILAVEYYKAHLEHVVSLTLCSAALDIPEWIKNTQQLLTTISDSAQQAVKVAEATKRYDNPPYQNALNEFYAKYVWRHPVEAELDSMMSTFNETIYNYMQGPSEFSISGTLKDYDATPFLRKIRVPVLYTVGEFDEANPSLVKTFASLTPDSRVVVLQGAAHMTPWDARDENVQAVGQFLRSVDSLRVGAQI